MELRYKTIKLKDISGTEGKASFVAAVFGNKDSGGDRILPGAFSDSLQNRNPKFILDHRWEAEYKLGKVDAVYETPEGLQVDVTFNMEKQIAREVHSDMIQDPEGTEFSIGYSVPKDGETKAADGANELAKIDLYEVSAVLIGMNDKTRLIAAKAALDAKVGSRNSATDAALIQSIHDSTANLGASCGMDEMAADLDLETKDVEEVVEETVEEPTGPALEDVRRSLDLAIAEAEGLVLDGNS